MLKNMAIIDVLSGAEAPIGARRGPGKQDERQPIQVGVNQPNNRSDGPGGQCSHTNAGASSDVPVRRRHNGRRPGLVRGHKLDVADASSLDDIEATPLAWYAKDAPDPGMCQVPHNDFCCCRHLQSICLFR